MDFASRLIASLFFSVFFSITATAAENCISKEEMTTIASHFTQFKNLSGKEHCYDGSHNSNLLKALVFMRSTQFEPNMAKSSDELFSGAFASDWWKYFTGRINNMSIQSNCPKGAAAYVTFFSGKTMFVCPLMLTDSFSALDRASIFMHEARHIDGYPHTTCRQGPRKGIQGACDGDISDRGSYAVTVETYAQLGKYAMDIHPALKAYARASSIIYAEEAFDSPVQIDRAHQFLVMTKDRHFHAMNINGGMTLETLGSTPALGQIMLRASHYILFPEDKTLPAQFVFTNDEGVLEQAPGADATEYNLQTPAEKSKLVAIHYGGTWGARIYQNQISYSCDPGAGAKTVTALSENAVSVIYPNGYSRDASSAHVQLASGKVAEFGCKSKTSGFYQPSSLKFDQLFKRLYKSGAHVVGLNHDGDLFVVQNGVSTPLTAGAEGEVFDLVPHQIFGFFDSPK